MAVIIIRKIRITIRIEKTIMIIITILTMTKLNHIKNPYRDHNNKKKITTIMIIRKPPTISRKHRTQNTIRVTIPPLRTTVTTQLHQ